MKTDTALPTPQPAGVTAVILGTTTPPMPLSAPPVRQIAGAGTFIHPVHADLSEKIREDLRRRHETPFHFQPWSDSGLND
jgi:hypothetical protein